MKTTKKLSHKHLRYLTKQEFKDPLYAVADFWSKTFLPVKIRHPMKQMTMLSPRKTVK